MPERSKQPSETEGGLQQAYLTQCVTLLEFLGFDGVPHLVVGHPERLDGLLEVPLQLRNTTIPLEVTYWEITVSMWFTLTTFITDDVYFI